MNLTQFMTLDEWYQNRILPKYTEFDGEQEYPKTIEEAPQPSNPGSLY